MRREPSFSQRAEAMAKPHKHHHTSMHKSETRAKGANNKKEVEKKRALPAELSKMSRTSTKTKTRSVIRAAPKKAAPKAGKSKPKHSKAKVEARQKRREMSMVQRSGKRIPGVGGSDAPVGDAKVTPPATLVPDAGETHDVTTHVSELQKGFKIKFKVNFTRMDRNDQFLVRTNNDAVVIQLGGPAWAPDGANGHIVARIETQSGLGPTEASTPYGVLGSDGKGNLISTKTLQAKEWYIVEFTKDDGSVDQDGTMHHPKLCLSVCDTDIDNANNACVNDEDKVCWGADPNTIIQLGRNSENPESDFDLRDDEPADQPTAPDALTSVLTSHVAGNGDLALFGSMGDFEISYGPGSFHAPTESSPFWGPQATWGGDAANWQVTAPVEMDGVTDTTR